MQYQLVKGELEDEEEVPAETEEAVAEAGWSDSRLFLLRHIAASVRTG